MDKNTADVLKKIIPSGSFVAIVVLVIFGPVDCIEIEIPGGGGITKCQPITESFSTSSNDKKFSQDKDQVTIEGIAVPITSSNNISNESYFYGQWESKGILSNFELQYTGNFRLNQDGTFKSSGTLDGEKVVSSGSYEFDPKNNKLALFPSDSGREQMFSLYVLDNDSFAIVDMKKSTGLVMKRI